MKTKVLNTILIAVSFLLVISSYSCKKSEGGNNGLSCPQYKETVYNIPQEDKSHVPYSGYDTIKLQYPGGPLATFIGNGKDSGYYKSDYSSSNCPGTNIHKDQFIQSKYICPVYSLPLYLKLQLLYGDYVAYVVVNFNGQDFSKGASAMRAPYDLDSITINGYTYKNILFLHLSNNYQSSDLVYYNVKNGIVRIISNGKQWDLVP